MPDGTPIYLLWHPVDHVVFKTTAAPGTAPVKGTNFTIVEHFLVNCSPAPYIKVNTSFFTCPASQTGFLRNDVSLAWQTWPQVNYSNIQVNSWNGEVAGLGSMSFAAKVKGLAASTVDAVSFTHSWVDGKNGTGLKVTTNVLIGLNGILGIAPAPAYRIGSGKTVNDQIIETFANGEHPIAAAWRMALHKIQEMGNLESLMPALVAASLCPSP